MLIGCEEVIVNGQFDSVGDSARDLQALIPTGNVFSITQTAEMFYMIHGGGIIASGHANEHGVVSVIRYG